jgi:hypothetical protein
METINGEDPIVLTVFFLNKKIKKRNFYFILFLLTKINFDT